MINIKELSIGNYVLHLGAAKKVGEIISFTEIVLFQEKYYGLHSSRVSINEIEPIPLTSEILENNGWNKDKHYFPEDENYDVELYEGDTNQIFWTINCYEYEIAKINYVHQLQNILTLYRIDKEIKL